MKKRWFVAVGVWVSMMGCGGLASAGDASVPDSGRVARDAAPPPKDASLDASTTEPTVPVADAHPAATAILVGGACTQSANCPSGLTCLPATSTALGGGGPPHGLCTVDCSKGAQADCDAVDPGSFCRPFDAAGKIAYCYEGCAGGSLSDTLKCHQRADMACAPTGDGGGYCAPTCNGHSDCGTRECDPVSGLCVDSVDGTLDIGAACDPAATTKECTGACLSPSASPTKDNSACTAVCTLGAPGACGVDPTSTAAPAAACQPVDPSEVAGDIGACVQLCDCNADCRNKSFVCAVVSLQVYKRAGMCVIATDSTGAAVSGIACGAGTGRAAGTGGRAGQSSADAGTAKPAKSPDSSGCGCRVGAGTAGHRNQAFAFAALSLGLLFRRRARSRSGYLPSQRPHSVR